MWTPLFWFRTLASADMAPKSIVMCDMLGDKWYDTSLPTEVDIYTEIHLYIYILYYFKNYSWQVHHVWNCQKRNGENMYNSYSL